MGFNPAISVVAVMVQTRAASRAAASVREP